MIAKQRRGNTRQVTLVLVYLGQALYPERLSDSQEGGQPVLVDADLSAIHEIQKAAHVHVGDIFKNDYRVLVGVANEKGLRKQEKIHDQYRLAAYRLLLAGARKRL